MKVEPVVELEVLVILLHRGQWGGCLWRHIVGHGHKLLHFAGNDSKAPSDGQVNIVTVADVTRGAQCVIIFVKKRPQVPARTMAAYAFFFHLSVESIGDSGFKTSMPVFISKGFCSGPFARGARFCWT